MLTVYFSILAGALLILGYIIYLGRMAHNDTNAHKRQVLEWEEEQERKQIAQLRHEKRRQEKVRLEEERLRQQVLGEIQPLILNFISANVTCAVADNFMFIKEVLQGRTIEMYELLQHNVNRTFADGKPYRVGLARKVNGQVISLQPEELEHLQLYFVNLIEFLSTIKSNGFSIDALSLQDMIVSEFRAQTAELSVEAL